MRFLSSAALSLLLAGGLLPGCEKKPTPPPAGILLASFEEAPGQAGGWGGGAIVKSEGAGGQQGYQVVFGDERSGLISRPGALSAAAADGAPRKLLMDVTNSTAPFLVYLALVLPEKDPLVAFQEVWVPVGESILEFDLSAVRSSGIDLTKAAVRVGPQKPGKQEFTAIFDNLRLSQAGPVAAIARESPPPPAESLVPQGDFEDGFSGWTPWTWGVGRATFAVVRGTEAFEGGPSAGVFHEVSGRAGLISPALDLPPGRYRLSAAVRGRGTSRIDVRRRELSGRPVDQDSPPGALEAAEGWEQKTQEVEVPATGPGIAAGAGPRPIQLIFTSDEGDFFIDQVLLTPLPAAEGGPAAAPRPPAPVQPRTHTVLIFDPKNLWEGSLGTVRALAADLSPAVLGGGPSAGARRLSERVKGQDAVRLWFIASAADSTAFAPSGATIGTTPAEIRAARRLLPVEDTRQVAVAAQPHPGSLETIADTGDLLVGGIPLREFRLSGGLPLYATGLDTLRRAADLIPPARAGARGRPAAAWIDARVKPGELEVTPEELRAMVYLAIVHRADAAVLAPLEEEKNAAALSKELERIVGELTEAAPDLADLKPAGEVEVTDRRVHARLGRSGPGVILILANTAPAAVEKLQIRLPAQIAPGSIERSLGPWECRIERLP